MTSYDFLIKYGIDWKLVTEVTNFQVDSRKVKPGSVFFALKGARCSGESFLKQVAENGGICAFVAAAYDQFDFNLQLIKVDDPLDILQKMARKRWLSFKAKTVGVTGSVGKTTTKEFIAELLTVGFDVGRSLGNANSQIGLPLTVLNFESKHEVLVLEMGMTEKGHIEKLAEIATPDVALITKVGYAHSKNFESLAHIAEAKAEIFTKNTQIKIADHDLLQFDCIQRHHPYTFSVCDKNANYFLDLKQKSLYENFKKVMTVELPFQEASFLHDLLGAIAVARQLGISYQAIRSKINALKPPQKRFEKISKNGVLFINDAYNSNPLSLRAALENLDLFKKRKIAVLGPMLELGKYSEKSHFEIGKLAAQKVEMLFTVGDECKGLNEAFSEEKKLAFHFSDISQLAQNLKQVLKEDDVVLVKASNSVGLEKLFELI